VDPKFQSFAFRSSDFVYRHSVIQLMTANERPKSYNSTLFGRRILIVCIVKSLLRHEVKLITPARVKPYIKIVFARSNPNARDLRQIPAKLRDGRLSFEMLFRQHHLGTLDAIGAPSTPSP
jgi:hypothetical protein